MASRAGLHGDPDRPVGGGELEEERDAVTVGSPIGGAMPEASVEEDRFSVAHVE